MIIAKTKQQQNYQNITGQKVWGLKSLIYTKYKHSKTMWRVSSQNKLYPLWSILDIWDLSCWNMKKIIRKCVILLVITSDIYVYV